jgi:hypothetical protein
MQRLALSALGWSSPTKQPLVAAALFGLTAVMELLQLWVPGQTSDPNVALISGVEVA